MHYSFFTLALIFSSFIAWAEEACIHHISASVTYQPPGYPATIPHLLAIGGKPLSIVWVGQASSVTSPVSVDQITATRRIPIAKSEAKMTENGWTWEWTPPKTRAAVTYEIRLEAKPESLVRVEVRDPDRFKELMTKLSEMAWESASLERKEIAALADLGLRRIASNARTTGTTAQLRMISSAPGNPRRQVTWDADQQDLVVWRPGLAAGDLEIRAPRWWISPEALATDQGRIRLLDLFSEPPVNP